MSGRRAVGAAGGVGRTIEAAPPGSGPWQPVCRLDELDVERGVAALVHGQAVAVFRTHDDRVHALGNHDPFSRASVLSRGIVGSRGDRLFVASPMHKHPFDLDTGVCLDDPAIRVPAYRAAVVDGVVLVGPRKPPAADGPVPVYDGPGRPA